MQFGEQQDAPLQDCIETSLMLQYKCRHVLKLSYSTACLHVRTHCTKLHRFAVLQ